MQLLSTSQLQPASSPQTRPVKSWVQHPAPDPAVDNVSAATQGSADAGRVSAEGCATPHGIATASANTSASVGDIIVAAPTEGTAAGLSKHVAVPTEGCAASLYW